MASTSFASTKFFLITPSLEVFEDKAPFAKTTPATPFGAR